MHRRWLSWTLLSTTVSAFYPYGSPDDHGDNERRFYPVDTKQQETAPAVTLDLKKIPVQKRDNAFPVILANKPDMPDAMAIDEDLSDFSYFSVMKFGSSKTPLYMLIDTGSANTWVFDSQCSSAACKTHNTFGTSDSSTLQITTDDWSLTYGTGQVTGTLGTDTVSIANYSLDLSFGLATTASDDFNSYPMDGILGLGPTSSSTLGVPTVMQKLDSANLLTKNIVGIHLQRSSDNTRDGQITFGAIDTTKFDGQLNYIPLVTAADTMWEIPVGGASVNGQSCSFTGRSAVVDTGTSYILMPLSDAITLHALIPGSSHSGEDFTLPCSSTAVVQFTFADVTYSVGPEDYLGKNTSSGSGECASNIVGHQAFGPNQWILGDVFLKNVYVVFDFDDNRIGFGAPSSSAASTAAGSVASSTASSSPSSFAHSTSSQSAASHTSFAATTIITSTASAKTSSTASSTSKSQPSSSSSTSSATATPTATPNSSPFGDAPNAASVLKLDVLTGWILLLALLVGLSI